jgi:transposase
MNRFVSVSDKEAEMNVPYYVELSQAERGELTALLSGGKQAARKLKRAQILLAADAGSSDEEIARTVAVGGSTVYRTKRRFVEGNLERALSEEQRPGAERKLTGKEEALLVATACASPPEGRARWTLELLADAMVKLTEHESITLAELRRDMARLRFVVDQIKAIEMARLERLKMAPREGSHAMVDLLARVIGILGRVFRSGWHCLGNRKHCFGRNSVAAQDFR